MGQNSIAEPPTTPQRPSAPTFENDPLLKTPPQHIPTKQVISPEASTNSFQPPSTPSSKSQKFDSLSNVPLTPYSHSNNLHSSPLKSPGALHDDGESKPPIRQISNTLKTRLSYAFVKYQKGWGNQSLDELEKSIDDKDDNSILPNQLQTSPPKSKKPAANKITKPIVTSNFKSPVQLSTVGGGLSQKQLDKISGRISIHKNDNADDEPQSPTTDYEENSDYEEGSANKAFLHAISKQTSPKRPLQPLKIPHTPNLKMKRASYNPEADAIESLMSLSSPQYSQSTHNGSQSNTSSPTKDYEDQGLGLSTKNYSFGESLKSSNNNDATDDENTGNETEDDITDDERSEAGS